jgi:hypothetical protein
MIMRKPIRRIGGNWLHGVYSSVYTDACKDVLHYRELPMPNVTPIFCRRPYVDLSESMLIILTSGKKIKFNTIVTWRELVRLHLRFQKSLSTSLNWKKRLVVRPGKCLHPWEIL